MSVSTSCGQPAAVQNISEKPKRSIHKGFDARRFRRMRSRTIVSLALFAVVALALPSIINQHDVKTNTPETKVPERPRRVASINSFRDSQAQSTQPLPSLHGKSARDYLKEHGLY